MSKPDRKNFVAVNAMADESRLPSNEESRRTANVKPAWWLRAIRRIGLIALWGFIGFVVLWCALALYYSSLPASLRPWAAWVFVAASAAALFFLRPRRRGLLAFLALVAVVQIYYWAFMPPSNDRHWR